MTAKEQIIKTVVNLPDGLTVAEILDNILYLNKIHEGAAQLDHGEGFSTEELRASLNV